MRNTFGARLRRFREQRGVSLAEIAEQTKIKASLLEGLERDDISQWPAGIFRRAYVRAYATAIGFDPDAALREFLALYPSPAVEPETPSTPPPGRLRNLVGSKLGTLLRRSSSNGNPPPSPATSVAATTGTHPDAVPVALALPPAPRPADAERTPATVAPISVPADTRPVDFLAAAKICTELGRVEDVKEVPPLLRDAAKLLGARGLIVWVWDAAAEELKPALVHGYSAKVRARLRGVKAGADNVTSAAYRAAAPLARTGALAVPLLAPAACAGVLAVELPDGAEQDADVRALATFFAAMLAQLVGAPAAAESREPIEAAAHALEAHPG